MTGREPGPARTERAKALEREEADERLAAEHPDEAMRRRDFLARTALLAGTAGVATALPIETVVSEAARRKHRQGLPSPRNLPIDTVVVLMMENRSFDHYFGWHPEADSQNEGLSYPDAAGNPVSTFHLTPDFQGCDFKDPDHGWDGGRHQYNNGANDGFVQGNAAGTGSDAFAAGYYLEADLGFIPHAGSAFTLYDRYFCSIMGSTFPNRHYQWAAQCGDEKSNVYPPHDWETIFDRAEANGVSVRYYNSDLPVSALYGQRGLGWTRPIAEYYSDAAAGPCPTSASSTPRSSTAEAATGRRPTSTRTATSASARRSCPTSLTRSWNRRSTAAARSSSTTTSGAGSSTTCVRGASPTTGRTARTSRRTTAWSGFRVPAVAISPFSLGGGVSHAFSTHESILKLISYRFGLGYLNKRHRYATNIGRTFDYSNPNLDPPSVPDPSTIAAVPCTLQPRAERPKPHDLAGLETSGLLDKLGYEVKPSTYDRIFREPDSVRRALEGSTTYE